MSENNFLDYCFNNNRINETDKTEILLLYTNLQTYNYYDVFTPDVRCKFHQFQMDSDSTFLDKYGGHYNKR